MINSFFLSVHNNNCCAVEHVPSINRGIVVLFSGLGQSKSGYAFFFSRMARWLCRMGFWVYQFDYRGFGDSDGNLEDVTLISLLEDAEKVIEYAIGGKLELPLILFGNGMGSAVAYLAGQKFDVAAHISFAPHLPVNERIRDPKLSKLFSKKDQIINIANVLVNFVGQNSKLSEEEYYLLSYFYSLGGYPENLKGQLLNSKLLVEIESINLLELMCRGRSLVFLDEKVNLDISMPNTMEVVFLNNSSAPYYNPETLDRVILETSSYLEALINDIS